MIEFPDMHRPSPHLFSSGIGDPFLTCNACRKKIISIRLFYTKVTNTDGAIIGFRYTGWGT